MYTYKMELKNSIVLANEARYTLTRFGMSYVLPNLLG